MKLEKLISHLKKSPLDICCMSTLVYSRDTNELCCNYCLRFGNISDNIQYDVITHSPPCYRYNYPFFGVA